MSETGDPKEQPWYLRSFVTARWPDPSYPEVERSRTVHVEYEKVLDGEGFVVDVVARPQLDPDLLNLIKKGVHVWFWPCVSVPPNLECEIANNWNKDGEPGKLVSSRNREGKHFLRVQNKGAVLVVVTPSRLYGLSVQFHAPKVRFDAGGIPVKMTNVLPVREAWVENSRFSAESAMLGEYDYLSEVVRELAVLCEENYPEWVERDYWQKVRDDRKREREERRTLPAYYLSKDPPSHVVWPPTPERPVILPAPEADRSQDKAHRHQYITQGSIHRFSLSKL